MPTQDENALYIKIALEALTGNYAGAIIDGIPVIVDLSGKVIAKVLTPQDSDYAKLVAYFDGFSDDELRHYLQSNDPARGLRQPAVGGDWGTLTQPTGGGSGNAGKLESEV